MSCRQTSPKVSITHTHTLKTVPKKRDPVSVGVLLKEKDLRICREDPCWMEGAKCGLLLG